MNKATTTDGTTPLNVAAQNGHSDVVAQLVQAGAGVNKALTTTGSTPLITCLLRLGVQRRKV